MDQDQLDSLLKQLQGFENASDSKIALHDVGSSKEAESILEPGEVEDQHDLHSGTFEHRCIDDARIHEPKAEDPGGRSAEQTEEAATMDGSALERLLATLVPLSTPSESPSYEPADPVPSYTHSYSDHRPPEPDLRTYIFAQALPVIGRLSEDPAFIEKLQEVRCFV